MVSSIGEVREGDTRWMCLFLFEEGRNREGEDILLSEIWSGNGSGPSVTLVRPSKGGRRRRRR